MNPNLFLSTFLLIFLAELGDKTQLAAMARAASSESGRWVLFLAASSALVLSTLVAVLFGSAITRVVPERTIKLVAGILFIVFGALIIRESVRPAAALPESVPATPLAAFVLQRAAAFERAAFDDYRQLVEQAGDPALKSLLTQIAADEDSHYSRIMEAGQRHEALQIAPALEQQLAEREDLVHNVAGQDRPVLDHALQHEKATAGFYSELARLTPVPALKRTFAALAAAEQEHVRRLTEFGDG